MQTVPEFRVLKRAEDPPPTGFHVLLVHRFSSDKRSLVHDITGRLPAADCEPAFMTGAHAFTGSPGEALRAADRIAAEHGAPVVYVRDDT